MSSVWEQRFARFIRRLANLRESSSLELLPDVMPVLPIVDPERVDLESLAGYRPCSGFFTQAAAPGFFNCQCLTNPTANTLLTIERLDVFGGAGGLQWGLMDGQPVANESSQKGLRDPRHSLTGVAIEGRWFYGTTGGAAVGQSSIGSTMGTAAFATPREYLLDLVVPPGWSFVVIGGAANEQLRVRIDWAERTVDRAELLIA